MNKVKNYHCSLLLFLLSLLYLAPQEKICAQPTTQETQIVAIQCGQLLDGVSNTAIKNAVILIEADKIIRVGSKAAIPENAKIIDLSGYTVLPGLIDAHTHICLTPDYPTNNPVLYKSLPFRTIEGVRGAQLNLEAGFTTLRDVDAEGAEFADVAIRDAINQGLIVGPRLQVAAMALSITGGHMNIMGLAPHIDVPQVAAITDTPDEMIREVRRQIKYGTDWIKLYTTGPLGLINRETLEPLCQMSQEEIRMIVEECNRWNIPVAAHAYGGQGATNAILAGVRSIEHGFFLNEEQLKAMVQRGTFWSPTMSVYFPETEAEKHDPLRNQIVESHKLAFKTALKLGVKIAFGTDVGAFNHGTGARELQLMVDYGMKPVDVIKSATTVAAELMQMQDQIGSIETGKYADVIAVKGDPLKEIGILEKVSFVMKGGVVVKDETTAEVRTVVGK